MTQCEPNDREGSLTRRLAREARATRPAFSEGLHARICRAVEREELPRPKRSAGARLPRRRLFFAATAAALLVGAALVASWLNRADPQRPAPIAKSPVPQAPSARQAPTEEPGAGPADVPDEVSEAVADPGTITGPTGQLAQHLGLLADEAVSEGQWAYLDHDLGVALRLLADQFPLDGESTEPL